VVTASVWPGVCPRQVIYMMLFVSIVHVRPRQWVVLQLHVKDKTLPLHVYHHERKTIHLLYFILMCGRCVRLTILPPSWAIVT